MKNQQNFKLIEGEFKASDATNILHSIFDKKINFHQLESFRIQERNSGNADYHTKRILVLQETYSLLKQYINGGSTEGYDFKIFCEVQISKVKKLKQNKIES